MSFTEEQFDAIKVVMEKFIEEIRPEEHIRPELDLGWRLEMQSVFIFSIRPQWDNPLVIRHYDAAKATWVKSKNEWQVYWLRSSGKWERYPGLPDTVNLQRFFIEVGNDPAGCFFG